MLGTHPDVATALNNMGSSLERQDKLDEAEAEVAQAAHNLADLYLRKGEYRKAVLGFEEALAIRRARLGDEKPETQASAEALAEAQRRLAGARPR